MTFEQVSAALTDAGQPLDAWLTLEGVFQYISLNNDRTIFIKPTGLQFYFTDLVDGNFLIIRYTLGNPVIYIEPTPPEGYVIVSHAGDSYLLQLEKGGKYDAVIGTFHDVVNLDCITGFFLQ